jgi:hypothetical protein
MKLEVGGGDFPAQKQITVVVDTPEPAVPWYVPSIIGPLVVGLIVAVVGYQLNKRLHFMDKVRLRRKK